ncbi:MAG TPA: hypothetical protein VND24_03610, partial [Steroidobacteraceae bacterium]|nr:hypothetical protein [Steroidobacteraceae bacterium]
MGKVSQPQSALSPRSPAGAAEPATAEALGWQLRAALPPMRLHSVSIYDSQGNVLWLSEGALGPDEHSLVLDALEALTAASGKSYCENRLEDGRIATVLAVRAPQGHLVGLAMILADFKSGGEGLMDRIMSAPTRTIMQKLAVLLRPAGPRRPDADPTALVLSLASDDMPVTAPEVQAAACAAATGPSARKGDDELSPRAVNDILEFELTDAPILAAARHSGAATAAATVPTAAAPPALANGHSRTTAGPAPAAHPAPGDTGSSQALKQPSSAETGSSRTLAGPASTGSSRAISLDPGLITL